MVGGDETEPLNITMEDFESLRLKDYQDIQQKKAAELMDISQPTFHRTLGSARKKITQALVEGKIIQIKGGDYIMDKKRYQCKNCGFEWQSSSKEYDKCPDCDSEMQLVQSTAKGARGMYYCCKKCNFREKYTKGQYGKYRHEFKQHRK